MNGILGQWGEQIAAHAAHQARVKLEADKADLLLQQQQLEAERAAQGLKKCALCGDWNNQIWTLNGLGVPIPACMDAESCEQRQDSRIAETLVSEPSSSARQVTA